MAPKPLLPSCPKLKPKNGLLFPVQCTKITYIPRFSWKILEQNSVFHPGIHIISINHQLTNSHPSIHGIGCCQYTATSVEFGMNSSLGNGNTTLLHNLMYCSSVDIRHLVKLVNTNDTSVSKYHCTSFQSSLTCKKLFIHSIRLRSIIAVQILVEFLFVEKTET